jgi:hypothetical protein
LEHVRKTLLRAISTAVNVIIVPNNRPTIRAMANIDGVERGREGGGEEEEDERVKRSGEMMEGGGRGSDSSQTSRYKMFISSRTQAKSPFSCVHLEMPSKSIT